MQLALTVVALASFGVVAYVYVGYYLLLWLLSWLPRRSRVKGEMRDNHELPSVSVIVAAYNEESNIRQRIENLLAQDYPEEKREVIICSDGSTDRTVLYSQDYRARRVRAFDFTERRGRGAVHNDGVREATGDLLVFTDAETRFAPGFLKELVTPFADPEVGCGVGRLTYRGAESGVAQSEGAYWRYELKLREMEHRLGILAMGSGACMAVRRSLFRPLRGVADVDRVTALDCVAQGYRVVYVPQAVAYDVPPASPRAEFWSRARITSRNLAATLANWGPRRWLRHPGVTWSLFSHKLLRWLSPYFLLLAFVATTLLAFSSGVFALLLLLQLAAYLLALVGGLAARRGRRVPLASLAFSFLLSNVAMGAGVVQGLARRAPMTYGQRGRADSS